MNTVTIGQKFGRLTVLSFSHNERSHRVFSCMCDCGNEALARQINLTRGRTTSCGCVRSEGWRSLQGIRANDPGELPPLPVNNYHMKMRLIEERGPACAVCGFDCVPAIQAHHLVPASEGGTNSRENIVLVCANCHSVIEYLRKTSVYDRSHFHQFTDEQFRLLEANAGIETSPSFSTSRLSGTIARLNITST